MGESKIQKDIFKVLNSSVETRVFRNNVGSAFLGKVVKKTPQNINIANPRFVRFGLRKGSSDLIGWTTTEVTKEMIGQKIAVFTSIEVKQKGKYSTDDQKNWINQVNVSGGIAGVARSADDAKNIIIEYLD